MKKILLPILFLTMFSSLSSKGFQFYNKTGRRIRIRGEACRFDGKKEKFSAKLNTGEVWTRNDFKEIEDVSVRTMKRKKGAFGWGGEVKTDKIHRRQWKRNIKCKHNKTRRLKFRLKDDKLRYKSSWIKSIEQ